jgi:hypothetical protein
MRDMEKIDQAMTVLTLTMGLCLMWEGYAGLSAVPKIAKSPAHYDDGVRLSGFDTGSTTALGGSPINATFTFSDLTPRAGVVVTMTSTDPSTVPVSDITVPAASKSWQFSISTRAVSTSKGIRITAGYRGIARSVVVKIQQFSPDTVGVNPSKASDGTVH